MRHVEPSVLEEHLSVEVGRSISLISVNKKLFMLGCGDGNIYSWNRESKELEAKLSAHSDHVTTMAFHPKQDLLVSGSCMGDGTLKIWDTKSYTLLHTLGTASNPNAPIDSPENRSYTNLAFTPNGAYLLAFYTLADDRYMLELFDFKTLKKIKERSLPHKLRSFTLLPKETYMVLYMEDSEDSELLIEALMLLGDGLLFRVEPLEKLHKQELLIKKEEEEYLFFSKSIWTHSFDSSKSLLVLGTNIGLDFWHLPTKRLLESWEIRDKNNHLKLCTQVAHLSSNRLVLLVPEELYIIEKDTQKLLYHFPSVECFAFHQELLAFSDEHGLKIFSMIKEEMMVELSMENRLDTLVFSPDAKLLAGSQLNNYLTVWESNRLNVVHREFSGQSGYCDNYAKLFFTPNGEHLVAFQNWRREAHIRQVNSFFPWRRWSVIKEFSVEGIAFHPKEDELALLDEEGEYIEILSTKDWREKEKIRLKWEGNPVDSLGYVDEGKWLLFVDEKGMIHLYNRQKNNEKFTLISGRKGHWVTVENGVIHDSGSTEIIPKNLIKDRDEWQ